MGRNNEFDRQPAFLAAYAKMGRVGDAARAAGLDRNTPAYWKKADPAFAEAMEGARQDFIESLEKEAIRRAKEGVKRGVYYQGIRCGEEVEYSDRLMEMILKANAPEKYRERSSVEHSGPNQGPITSVVSNLTDEQLERIIAGGCGEGTAEEETDAGGGD